MPFSEIHRIGMIAAAGGVLWAMMRIMGVIQAPKPATDREIRGAIIDGLCGVVGAVIGGLIVAPAIIYQAGIEAAEIRNFVVLMVGISFWQTLPMTVRAIGRAAPEWLKRLLGTKDIRGGDDADRG